MFNINALINFINTNNNNTIEEKEIKKFLKTQDKKHPSLFTNYFNSIQEDIKVDTFKIEITRIIQDAEKTGIKDIKLNFNKKHYQTKYQQIKNKIEMQSDFYRMFGYKFKTDEEFNSTVEKLLNECKNSEDDAWEYVYEGLIEATSKVTPREIMQRLQNGNFSYIPEEIQFLSFEDEDLTQYTKAFKKIPFNKNTFAKVSSKNLPEGFNPLEILEKGKTIGLGISEAHAQGYKGNGISYAIIDSGVAPHNDINFKEYNIAESAKNIPWLNHFHGSAVSYIAQEIAPEADCYYFATNNGGEMDSAIIENLRSILEKNKKLPEKEKIRFVSMSMPLYGGEEAKQIISELEKQGVWVYHTGCPENKKIGYLEKINQNGDPDDFNNYQISLGKANQLYVNAGDRTVPDPSGPNAYRHDPEASRSWAIPVIAGYYTLACQADSTMTKEKFLKLAEQSAQIKNSTKPNFVDIDEYETNEESSVLHGRLSDVIEIKIIDINALLKAIERQAQ